MTSPRIAAPEMTRLALVSYALTPLSAIYTTTTSWWTSCTGNSASFGTTNPLWIAHWASSIGTLPAGWSFTTFWQYADS
ncbi:hypothetical protein EDB84DRAFT_1511071, partial [Lactarius hengduanensis]